MSRSRAELFNLLDLFILERASHVTLDPKMDYKQEPNATAKHLGSSLDALMVPLHTSNGLGQNCYGYIEYIYIY